LCPLTPAAATDPDFSSLHRYVERVLEREATSLSGVYCLRLSALTTQYKVGAIFDAYADEIGHIPFTQEWFTAMGTLISRSVFALRHEPYKVVVLDCDHTLWRGLCGEDGTSGISIEPAHQALQRFMLDQLESGKLLCLCSKNNEEDVFRVFHERSDMLLKLEHLASIRINWKNKPENLQSLANELGLSLDSFIFIDDSIHECAEVRVRCPEVITLHLPSEEGLIETFLENAWVFDHLKVTEDDKLRSLRYQQDQERKKLRTASVTLDDFLAELDLRIRIKAVSPQEVERVAQLTQRTNQFNLTGIRRSAAEIERLLANEAVGCQVVELSDRFGDYGLVGVMIYMVEADTLEVDTFLLSCRALGRNVEDNVLMKLGELAGACDCREVRLTLRPTPKNTPALTFLERVFGTQRQLQDGQFVYRMPIHMITSDVRLIKTNYGYRFRGVDIGAERRKEGTVSGGQPGSQSADRLGPRPQQLEWKGADGSGVLQRIAAESREAKQILSAIRERRRSRRSNQGGPPVAPRTPTEERMAKIWMDVLNLDRVGVHDNFFGVGGHSLLATQLVSRVRDAFGVSPPLRSVFETPTIATFSEAVTKELMNQLDSHELTEMLAQINEMSDKDVASIPQ